MNQLHLFFIFVIDSLVFLYDLTILRAQCRFHTANVVRNSQICNCALDLCKNTMLDIKNPWPLQYHGRGAGYGGGPGHGWILGFEHYATAARTPQGLFPLCLDLIFRIPVLLGTTALFRTFLAFSLLLLAYEAAPMV